MANKKKQEQFKWLGNEGKLYRGEPVFRMAVPRRNANVMQADYIRYNYKDKVLTVSHWFDKPYAPNSGSERKIKTAIGELLNPRRSMVYIKADTIMKGSMIINAQYFALLDKLPPAEKIPEIFKAIEENIIPLSLDQFKAQRLESNIQANYATAKEKRWQAKFDTDD